MACFQKLAKARKAIVWKFFHTLFLKVIKFHIRDCIKLQTVGILFIMTAWQKKIKKKKKARAPLCEPYTLYVLAAALIVVSSPLFMTLWK